MSAMEAEDKFIVEGPPALDVPSTSLGQYLLEKLLSHGDQIALIDATTGESLTYYEAYRKSIALAQNLQALGIRKGDAIGISSENNVNFVLPVLAASYLGAACAPFNSLYSPGELLHTMSLSRPRIMFASSMTIQRVVEVSKAVDSVRDIVLITDNPPPNTTGFIRLPDLLTPLRPVNTFKTTPVCSVTDTVTILCSSGTTGLPKGVELTHSNFLHFIHVNIVCNLLGEGEVFPGIVPFFHGYGLGLLYMALAVGIKIVSLPRFEEKLFLKTIQDYKVTQLYLVPPVMVFLGKHPLVDQFDLSSLRGITCGAAPLSREAQEAVEQRLRLNFIRQGYGMTEVTIVAAICTTPETNKMGSSGQLVPGSKAKLLDVETGTIIPPNKPGVLCLKGPMIMKGYRSNPKETEEMIDKDGWLITGDIGYFDEDGYLYVVDRVKELIKYKAYQVPPAELEAILYTHPGIKDAGVVGKPDDEAGELPLAFVVRQPTSNVTEKEILDYVAARVSPQKRLRGGIRFVSEIPRNPSGKILRRVLRTKL